MAAVDAAAQLRTLHPQLSLAAAGLRLHVAPRTLQRLTAQAHTGGLKLRPRGRRPREISRQRRNEALRFLDDHPCAGLPTLAAAFPDFPRRALANLARRRSHAHARRYGGPATLELRWTCPGAVWAIDHSKLECGPIDGLYPYLLVVRDLGSGRTLEALPTAGEDAATVVALLSFLFAGHGPPLVLKLDNGAAFASDAVRRLADESTVTLLHSPTYYPAYNGSCERGIGWIKCRLFYAAALHGRLDQPTSADVEQARQLGNAAVRRQGGVLASPDALWESRQPLSPELRSAFAEARQRRATDLAQELLDTGDEASHQDSSAIARTAVERALVDLDLLAIRRRGVSLPKKARRRAKIT